MRDQLMAQPDERDSGFTLIEMLVVMIVLGVAMSLTFTAMIRVQRYTSDVSSSADAVDEARQGLAQVDRTVRSGNVIDASSAGCSGTTSTTGPVNNTLTKTISGTCVTVFSQSNGVPRCYQWVVTTTGTTGTQQLKTRSWSPAWATDHNYTGWSVVARNLVATSSSTPFKVITVSDSTTGKQTAGDVLQVRFDAYDTRRKAATPIKSTLFGRNTIYGYDATTCSVAPSA